MDTSSQLVSITVHNGVVNVVIVPYTIAVGFTDWETLILYEDGGQFHYSRAERSYFTLPVKIPYPIEKYLHTCYEPID